MESKKLGRNDPCHCGKKDADGKIKKYKYCCLLKDEENAKRKEKVTYIKANFRRLMISGPYKQCPNPACSDPNSFGVFTPMGDQKGYSRECIKCGHQQGYSFPKIKKKILYLDQFVISNLIKLLDKSHPSHAKIKSDPFWSALFIKLEAATRSQAIVCPDSYYHRDESLTGKTDFKLMKRLYEHFSSGKTLHPSFEIEHMQIAQHFEKWLAGEKTEFDFKARNITSEDLDTWSVGLRVSVNMRPYPGEIDNLNKVNTSSREQLKELWTTWQNTKNFNFLNQIKEETLGLGKGLLSEVQKFSKRRQEIMTKFASGQNDFDLEDLLPPPANSLLEHLLRVAKSKGLSDQEAPVILVRYFRDVDVLLEIPKIHISSVMFASLARNAALGKKKSPKSLNDVGFISSYLPYCDALFVDIESAGILRELPKETPPHLRFKKFEAKVFSLNEKEQFLSYLDQVVKEIPSDQLEVLKDLEGEDYTKPYWSIIEQEKMEKD